MITTYRMSKIGRDALPSTWSYDGVEFGSTPARGAQVGSSAHQIALVALGMSHDGVYDQSEGYMHVLAITSTRTVDGGRSWSAVLKEDVIEMRSMPTVDFVVSFRQSVLELLGLEAEEHEDWIDVVEEKTGESFEDWIYEIEPEIDALVERILAHVDVVTPRYVDTLTQRM